MPTDPKRLQIIDRVVYVLRTISAGTDYFFTFMTVCKGFERAPQGFPACVVFPVSGGQIQHFSDGQHDETFYLVAHGIVQDVGDVVTPLERALYDVRKALKNDMKPEAGAGSLGTLATDMLIDEPPEIDYDQEGALFMSYFDQRVGFIISGEFGEI